MIIPSIKYIYSPFDTRFAHYREPLSLRKLNAICSGSGFTFLKDTKEKDANKNREMKNNFIWGLRICIMYLKIFLSMMMHSMAAFGAEIPHYSQYMYDAVDVTECPTHSRLIISLKSGALASERRKGVDPRVNVGVVLWKVESIFAIMSAESGKSKCAIWFFQITHPSASHIRTDDMFLLFKIITALRAQVYDYIHYTLSKMHFLWK